MADSASSPATHGLEPDPKHSESGAPNTIHNQSDPVLPSTQSSAPSSTPLAPNPNPNPSLASPQLLPPPPPTISYAAGVPPHVPGVLPPSMPSFRPLAPQFSPLPTPGGAPNLTYQNPAVPPPGVASAAAPVPHMPPMLSYQVPPGQPTNPALRPFVPLPNGYAAAPPQGTMTLPVS